MTPKLLFFDIDGTLLDYTGKMPASAKEALRQARLTGHRLVICSGRSGHQLSDWMFTDFDGIINCTGARVIFKQNVIYEHFVPWEDVRRAREVLEAANGVLVAQTEECTILSQESGILGEEPVILMAEDIAPSETVQMDKTKLLSFVTRLGSANSHTAILARTMGIPALVGVDIDQKYEGKLAIVDGYEGKFIVDPDREVLTAYTEKKQQDDEKKKLLQQLRGKENVTKSGKKINLYANIGSYGDLAAVIENDAGGIGLFRSEFLYLENSDFPTEEEQFAVYRKVVETMGGKKVIIRTLDIGADKQIDYFGLEKEENPALLRLIRMVTENGHKEGIWTGICGELGADTSLTADFIHAGVDELSVSPGAVLSVRRAIRETE